MEKIITPRGHGKTLQLIKKSASSGNYIVCSNSDEAKRIFSEAVKMGLKIPFPITYREFIRNEYKRELSGFLIDNVDLFVKSFTNVPINAITLSV